MSVSPLPPATIGAEALPLVTDALAASGLDPAGALSSCGLARDGDPPALETIPLACFTQLLQAAGAQSRDGRHVWRCGRAIVPQALATLFPHALQARRVGELLDRLLAELQALQRATRFSRDVVDDTCVITYRILDPAIWPRSRDAEFTLGFLDAVARAVTGEARVPFAVGFEHDRDSGADFAALCGLPPTFAAPVNHLALPAALLDRAVSAEAFAHASRRALARRAPELSHHAAPCAAIAEAIYRRLGQGPFDQAEIARDCGLSQRSLRRRLDAAGLTFRDLKDEARLSYAVWALGETTLPVGEIAHRLGYAGQGAFARAFRRKTGQAPSRLRRARDRSAAVRPGGRR